MTWYRAAPEAGGFPAPGTYTRPAGGRARNGSYPARFGVALGTPWNPPEENRE